MEPDHSAEFVVGPVDSAERDRAADLAASGMRDNPLHMAVIGADPANREHLMRELFRVLLTHDGRSVLGAWQSGRLVGMAGYAAPGCCQPAGRQLLTLIHPIARFGVRAPRALRWLGSWARRDPKQRHTHLGPVAVDPEMRGRGIGSRLLGEYAAMLDTDGRSAYLETDRIDNVRFYQRFGFSVCAEAEVIGVRNWFMLRDPAAPPGRD